MTFPYKISDFFSFSLSELKSISPTNGLDSDSTLITVTGGTFQSGDNSKWKCVITYPDSHVSTISATWVDTKNLQCNVPYRTGQFSASIQVGYDDLLIAPTSATFTFVTLPTLGSWPDDVSPLFDVMSVSTMDVRTATFELSGSGFLDGDGLLCQATVQTTSPPSSNVVTVPG